jgi:SET and MYND domain-containing protein
VQGHLLRGLALAELGKLLSVDEPVPKYLEGNDNRDESDQKGVFPPSGPARLRLAKETLIRAQMELMVGFGWVNEGGEVGMEVGDWLVRVEKELQVWKAGVQSVAKRP